MEGYGAAQGRDRARADADHDLRRLPAAPRALPAGRGAGARGAGRGVGGVNTPGAGGAARSAVGAGGQAGAKAGPVTGRQVVEVPADWRGSLDEKRSKELFARFGLRCVREVEVGNAAEASAAAGSFGGSVVLKILSSTITHKSDVGGVAVSLDAETVGPRLERMREEVERRADVAPEGYIVQEMVPPGGLELILGCHRDALGSVLLLGLGGVTAELMKDTTIRLLAPGTMLSREEALSMAQELKGWPLLDGYRGRLKLDVDALISAIVDFSTMVAQLGDRLSEAEINPLFVLPEGQGTVAADGVAVLAG
ncbi:hypothetical protein B6S44_27320 [Bosea sp. Tri-44]|nr:hypothetical protein B6S44_27320 [Bosea sp. Tri-44]